MTSRLDVYKQPMWIKQWPFAHTIGFHPYYRLDDSPRGQWTVTVPAKTHWLLANTKVATGDTEPGGQFFPNGQGQLKDYNLDDVFSGLTRDAEGRAHIFLKGSGKQQLELIHGPNFRAMVVWSPNPLNTGKASQLLSTGAGHSPLRLQSRRKVRRPPRGRGGRGGGGNANAIWQVAGRVAAVTVTRRSGRRCYEDRAPGPVGGSYRGRAGRAHERRGRPL